MTWWLECKLEMEEGQKSIHSASENARFDQPLWRKAFLEPSNGGAVREMHFSSYLKSEIFDGWVAERRSVIARLSQHSALSTADIFSATPCVRAL